MKFNDKPSIEIQPSYNSVFNQEQSGYQRGSLKESDYPNRMSLASKLMKKNPMSQISLLRGKENQGLNSFVQQNQKNVITNHSFNGYFNENSNNMRIKMQQSISKKIQSSATLTNKPTPLAPLQQSNQPNFHSSTKLSNYHFQSSSSNISLNQKSTSTLIHDQVKAFISKYFSQSSSHCQQLTQLSQQYVSINDFVQILFEQFEDLIGMQASGEFSNEFGEKVYGMFGGENVYFGDLYEKTAQNGLTGLIFQIVKGINQDKSNKVNCEQLQLQSKMSINKSNYQHTAALLLMKQQQQRQQQLQQQMIQLPQPKSITSSKSNSNLYNNKNSRFVKHNAITSNNTQKISLNKFFGTNSTSKIQFPIINNTEQSKAFFDESTILYLDQNLQQVKKILSDYVQNMYEQAQLKLNKKYSQQVRKISLKYKETERLLQKINQKISSHYDTLEMQKQYQRRFKEMTQRQNDLQQKLKKLQYELKQSKDDIEKEKQNYTKLDQQFNKVKDKLQKYENAIFEKAMQKTQSQSGFSQQTLPVYVDKGPQIEVKLDTYTEHSRPVIAPLVHSPSYSSYMGRQIDGGSISPLRTRQNPNRMSISPIKQRISFVKGQNPPSLNPTKQTSQVKQNSRVSYSPALNTVTQMNRVEFGERVSLKAPLNQINKTGQSQQNGIANNGSANNLRVNVQTESSNSSQVKSIPNHSNPISYSPLKIQFCTSQVGNFNLPKS